MAALTSRDEPKVAEYAGDEVSAVVLDPGYNSVRAGFAGEDTPKSIVPSYYAATSSQNLFGDHVIDAPREDVAIKNPYSADGLVEDWDTAEALWSYSFASRLTGIRPNKALQDWLNDPTTVPNLQQAMAEAEVTEKPLQAHPLFMTEPNWNPPKAREKCAEIALEGWATPAFFLGKSAVMATFAGGKPTALVIDIGAANLSVAAVHDGMILRKSVVKANVGGNYLSSQVRNMLAANDPSIHITPHYLIKSKQPVDAGQSANAIFKTFPDGYKSPQDSFRRYQEEKIVLEFKEIALQTWTRPEPFRGQGELTARDQYPHPFEFPDGYNQLFSSERFKIVETLFDNQCHTPATPGSYDALNFPQPEQQSTIPGLVKQCLNQVDVDLRAALLSGIIITGGSSLIKGLPERIQAELGKMYPSTRVRVQAAGLAAERKFGSWLGGSIMSSLGTFHQMWISKNEYDEHGANIVEKRCK